MYNSQYDSILSGWSAYQGTGDRLFKKPEPSSLVMHSAKNDRSTIPNKNNKTKVQQLVDQDSDDILDIYDRNILDRVLDRDDDLTSPGGDENMFFAFVGDNVDADLDDLTDEDTSYPDKEVDSDEGDFLDEIPDYGQKAESSKTISDTEIDKLLAQGSDDETVEKNPATNTKKRNVRLLPSTVEAKKSFDSYF
jgi:hypothetical protein